MTAVRAKSIDRYSEGVIGQTEPKSRRLFKNAFLDLLPAGHWLQLDEPALVAAEMLS